MPRTVSKQQSTTPCSKIESSPLAAGSYARASISRVKRYSRRTFSPRRISSANGEAIPFIAGITCERLPDDLDAFPVDLSTTIAWGQLTTSLADGILTVANSDISADWAGLRFSPHTPVTLTAQQMRQGYLVFEINGGNDPFGCHKGNTSLQVSCPKGFHRLNLSVDSNPNTFQLRRIPLARWQDKSKAPTFDISSIAFQYTGTGKTAGFQLRNVRLEVPKAP